MKTSYIVLKRSDPGGHDPHRGLRSVSGPERNDQALERHTVELSDRERERLRADPGVSSVAPGRMRVRLVPPMRQGEPQPISNAATLCPPWGIAEVMADQSEYDGDGVVVAVLDTGIDKEHECFKGMNLVCQNFTDDGVDTDVDGHGTHCAATIFGRSIKGSRVGVAPGVKRALIGKVISGGTGTVEGIVKGLEWAIENKAHVISMSLGLDFPGYAAALQDDGLPSDIAASRALADYYDTVTLFEHFHEYLVSRALLVKHSALLVAAAGNESRRDQNPEWTVSASPPSNARGIVSVGALGRNGEVCSFSNTGANISAPGDDIVSAWPNDRLRSLSGTSSATPHVAGVAALWGQKRMRTGRAFDSESVLTQMRANARPLDHPEASVGTGLVQAP